jgi:hypothetical protein
VFANHNIQEVQFTFDGHSFLLDTISIGKIQNDNIEKKLFYDYIMAPPFGMTMDPDKITLANNKNGGAGTPYPHVYINFSNYGDKTRIQPSECGVVHMVAHTTPVQEDLGLFLHPKTQDGIFWKLSSRFIQTTDLQTISFICNIVMGSCNK